MAVGMGFDIHRLVPGRKLVLGGVAFDHPFGLLGHSDGDVVIHAVIDAILGATGGGDIGDRFPDSDPRYAGIDSQLLLKQVVDGLKGWRLENIDVTVAAEQPKLGPRKKEIARNVAKLARIDEARVNVKGKTAEGLGPVGNREAIACMAVCQAARA